MATLAERLAADPGAASARTADGFTPLHYAAFFGGPEVTRVLLDAGADPGLRSANDFAVMPLHSAVAAGRTEVALLLIAAGADPDVTQRHGWTPLHGAADNGLAEVVGEITRDERPQVQASAIEFVLEGLHLNKRLNKDRVSGRALYRG